MAKKLNSMPDYQARMPKHPHDVGQSITFTASTGMELPVYYDMLHLGDELHFNGNLFARLNPLVTAALAQIDLHVDYFFVPLSVIYTPSTSIFYQTDDLVSGVFSDSLVKNRFPVYDLDEALYYIRTASADGSVNGNMKKGDFVYPNTIFDCIGKAAYRLCDLFDYNPEHLFGGDETSKYNPVSTPWFLAAYQACHELYFRNDDREPKSYCYNLDGYYSNATSFTNRDLLRLNYVSAYKDYFNAVKVSPIGSSVSMLNGSSSWDLLAQVDSYLFSNIYHRADASSSIVGVTDGSATTIRPDNTSNPNNQFTSANIRQLFMVDKLLRVTGRASKDYESQFLAHFGIKIPHDVLHNITHIGHDMCTLSPSPVISSANTFDSSTDKGSALGEIGGQGQVSMNGRKRHFTAPCHGVFLAIFHAQPRMRYYAGINKLHDLSDPMKFWQPEYDRKGMQPLFQYETIKSYTATFSSLSSRIGWQFAYEQFKRKYDKVSRAFYQETNQISVTGVNTYSPWVANISPYTIPTGISKNPSSFTGFLSSPHDLDGILQVTYQSTWVTDLIDVNAHLLFQTDPFIIDFRMDNKKVNYMSEFGEPELD